MKHERTIAVFVVVAALFFVGYQALSGLSGAVQYKNEGYENCYDSDPANDVTVRGEVTGTRLNLETDAYEPIEPKIDECIGPSRVREWSCTGYDKPKPIETSTYCPAKTECRNGACV